MALKACALLLLIGGNIYMQPTFAASDNVKFDASLRYRYEIFSRDEDMVTPPNAESKASTLRLGVTLDARINEHVGGFLELESVHQVGEDDYNIPTIPGQAIAGFPVIADPQGTELNQAYLRLYAPGKSVFKLGRQEIMLNDGRLISNSAWRQNHQSFDAASLMAAPYEPATIEIGYLSRVLRVFGSEASNGRTDLSGKYFNLGYTIPDIGVAKLYGVLLDFDTEVTNSTDTYGIRYVGNLPLGRTDARFLATVDYARQYDAADNPNQVDVDYRLVEAGLKAWNIDFILGNAVLGGKSSTNKFSTPLAHPFNGFTELFLFNPSLGTANHGLDARYLRVAGAVPGIRDTHATLVAYDYKSDAGDVHYGNELDIDVVWKASRIGKDLRLGWRFGRYRSDQLFSDALRTSVWASYAL